MYDIQVFLSFTNFYRQFIKNFSKISALLSSILKTTTLSVPARPACIRANENKLDTDGGSGIGSSRINDKIANLSNFTKKISSEAGFLTPKASLAFIQ